MNNCRTVQKRLFSLCPIYRQTEFKTPTVYALSTAPARSAIGVIRITGPSSLSIFEKLTLSKNLPKHRIATLRKLYDITTNRLPDGTVESKKLLLDECLVLFFQNPKSYTGEDLLELHLHGGTAIINKVMQTIAKFHTPSSPIRLAEPGEFSQRGFQNQRFDLTEVEGINTLIHAETELQRVSALASMKGETNVLFNEWRERILKDIALLTTVIDFGEDHDIEEINDLFGNVEKDVVQLKNEVEEYLRKLQYSQVLLDGIKLTLVGPPNAGKSSLLNILAQEDKAIVSNIPGTTRDSMDVPLDINGFKVVVGDTAGIRESDDIIEKEGIKRAKKKSLNAHMNVLLYSADEMEINSDFLLHAKALITNDEKQFLVIINKADLVDHEAKKNLSNKISQSLGISEENVRFISCKTNQGIEDLVNDLTRRFKTITNITDKDPITISTRAKDILINDVLFGFEEFLLFKEEDDITLASEALRSSVEGIGKITGDAIGVEEILGVVFSKFCIGK